MDIELEKLILVVTGAHLHAEAEDRPVAYRLQRAMQDRVETRGGRVLVCSDVWYMNNEQLRPCPTVSVGGPAVNAVSAYLADKLPSAFVVEGKVIVQADPEFDEAVACCWGNDGLATGNAVGVFAERYMDGFLEAAARDWN